MNFQPLHDNVVIERAAKDGATKSGIIIPDSAQDKPQEGRVLAVGPGVKDDYGDFKELSVKEGDRVIIGKWSGIELTIEGIEVVVLKESDIVGIVS